MDTLHVIRSLRSAHWDFSDRKVSREDIDTIIAHSLCAANNSNRTDISVVVVDDPETLNTVSGGDSGGKSVPTLFYLLDHTRLIHCAQALGYPDFLPKIRLYHFLFGMYDVCAAAQTAAIAAKAMGIDSLVTNFAHRSNPDEIKKLLNLPEAHCFPAIQVALGYPAEEKPQEPREISTSRFVHYGKYRAPDQEDVQAIVRDMDTSYPQFTSEKYPHAIDWFFNEWWVEWYDEAMYRRLADAFAASKVLSEPSLMNTEGH